MLQVLNAFLPCKGLDLVSPEESLEHVRARKLQNVDLVDSPYSQSITARRGFKHVCSQAGFSIGKYVYGDTATGEVKEEYISIGANGYKLSTGTFVITYSGSASSVTATHIVVDGNWTFILKEGSSVVLTYVCGKGFDEATVYTLADLKTAIDSLTDYSVTITGDSTQPCAFLPPVIVESLSSGTLSIEFTYPTALAKPGGVTSTFSGFNTNRNSPAFEPATFANIQNIFLIANGYDELQKYDGLKVYRAGLPEGSIVSATPVTGASTLSDTYEYLLHYQQTDYRGNVTTGAQDIISDISPSSQDVDIVINNIQDSTGFNTDMAVVNGAQSSVTTITVDSGHGLRVGDKVYVLDTSTSTRIAELRAVTATTATTITIDGAAVDVTDNSIISVLAACLYRNKGASSGTFYALAVLPCDSSASTQTFRDAVADANLGASYILQARDHDLPPKGRYLQIQNDRVIISGIFAEPNTVYYSDNDGPEYFPIESNSFDVYAPNGGIITGIFAYNEYLVVGLSSAMYLVTGALGEEQFVRDFLSLTIGCVSHHTFAEIGGTSNFPKSIIFLSQRGLHRVELGTTPVEISEPILSLFQSDTAPENYKYKRAFGVLDARRFKYYLYLPVQANSGTEDYHTDSSEVYVFDYLRTAWLGPWTMLNFGGGALFDDDTLYFIERRVDSVTSNARYNLQKFSFRNDNYSQVDHVSAVDWEWVPGWVVIGDSENSHRFTHIKLYSSDPSREVDFSVVSEVETNFVPDLRVGSDMKLSFNSGGGIGFGEGAFGEGAFGDPNTPSIKAKIPITKARCFRVRFSHSTIYERPIISSVKLMARSHRARIRE